MMKPYKSDKPENTINNIRNILHNIGLSTVDLHFDNIVNSYSCRVIIDGDKISPNLNIGTNGKGMTSRYSLASAYGELMERIQNKALARDAIKYATKYTLLNNGNEYLKNNVEKNNATLDFQYYPDEEVVKLNSNEELKTLFQTYLPNSVPEIHCKSSINFVDKLIFAPFFNVFQSKTSLIPVELLRATTGSTGMCAGNNETEAIKQGICEIFERYVLQQIFLTSPKLPTLNNKLFKDTNILSRLEELRIKQNIHYEIKDCSINKELPVIGLLLLDKGNRTYTFRLGADPSPIIALERCFTETFQGENAKANVFRKISFDAQNSIPKEYFKCRENGTGNFPLELLDKTDIRDTMPFYYEGASDKDDIKYLLETINKLNSKIFIRDNSFLGFPSYYIYITGLSETDIRLENPIRKVINSNEAPISWNIKNASDKKLFEYVKSLEDNDSEKIKLVPFNLNPKNSISKEILICLIYHYLGDEFNAYNAIKRFIAKNESKTTIHDYYYCVRDYLYLNINNHQQIYELLIKLYGNSLVDSVIKDMSDNRTAFKHFKIPQCFNCTSCNISEDCHFFNIIQFEKEIQSIQKVTIINQNNLKTIFF